MENCLSKISDTKENEDRLQDDQRTDGQVFEDEWAYMPYLKHRVQRNDGDDDDDAGNEADTV